MPELRLLPLWTALLVLVLVAGGCARAEESPPTEPVLRGELLDGSAYDPAAHRGKVLVVNFWASWCVPCRYEAPDLVAAYQATRADDVAFLGINVRDPDRDKGRAFADNERIPYPNLYDPAGRLALEFDVPPSTIPATLIIGRDGRTVVAEFRRQVFREELESAIRRAVEDSRGS